MLNNFENNKSEPKREERKLYKPVFIKHIHLHINRKTKNL